MKVAIIEFPGSNCQRDVYVALKRPDKVEPIIVWHQSHVLPEVDLVILPGGFSYGDYLRTGALAAKSAIIPSLHAAADKGTYILGICNGFQILTEIGLLPGALICNKNLRFISSKTFIKVANNKSIYTCSFNVDQVISLPIAHKTGNYYGSEREIKSLEDKDLIAFRYWRR